MNCRKFSTIQGAAVSRSLTSIVARRASRFGQREGGSDLDVHLKNSWCRASDVVSPSLKRFLVIIYGVLPIVGHGAPILDQSYINVGSLSGPAIVSVQSAIQTFTVGAGGALSDVGVQLYQNPGTVGDVTLAIMPTSGGLPVLSAPLFSTQIQTASLPIFSFPTIPVPTVPITTVNVSAGNIRVTPGEQFAISLTRSGAGVPPWVVWTANQSGTPNYSGGSSFLLQGFGGSAGSLIPGSTVGIGSLGFQTYVDPLAPPPLLPKPVPRPAAPIIGSPVGVTASDPSSPVVVITHGWQPTGDLPTWVNDMRDEIGSSAKVVPWLWSDAYTLNFSNALSEVQTQGVALGKYLLNLHNTGGQSLDHLQLVGHSLGTLVNAYAANYLIQNGVNVEQVTILDRPFGNGLATTLPEIGGGIGALGPNLDEPIFQTLLPKGKVTWVDNYYGQDLSAAPPAFGAAFQTAIAYNQAIPNADHSGVHEWYGCTMGILVPNCVGLPLLSIGDISSHKGFPWSSAGGRFDERPSDTGWDPGTVALIEESIQIDPIAWLTLNCVIAAEVGACKEGSPAYLWDEDFFIPDNAKYLAFDYRWLNVGDGDYMSLHFGDELLFNFLGETFSGSEFVSSGLIPISGFAGMTDQLLFSLNNVGDTNAEFEIGNIRFLFSSSVPEPSSISLMALALMFLVWTNAKRVRRVRRCLLV